MRQADEDRLVLLSSGRWDGVLSIGSVSNPGSSEWDYVWGNEAPGAPSVGARHDQSDFWWKVGDIHFYPQVPENQETDHKLRTLGQDAANRFSNPNTASEA